MQTLLPTLAINSLRAARSGLDTQRAADLFLPTGTPRATVAFLHGWSDRSPSNYLAWIQHLTDSGVAVVFPRYQTSLRASRKQMLESAESSLREGLAELGDDCGPLILAGYSFGAGICVIAAAMSKSSTLESAFFSVSLVSSNMMPCCSTTFMLVPESACASTTPVCKASISVKPRCMLVLSPPLTAVIRSSTD